jgi:hypothetical protein
MRECSSSLQSHQRKVISCAVHAALAVFLIIHSTPRDINASHLLLARIIAADKRDSIAIIKAVVNEIGHY